MPTVTEQQVADALYNLIIGVRADAAANGNQVQAFSADTQRALDGFLDLSYPYYIQTFAGDHSAFGLKLDQISRATLTKLNVVDANSHQSLAAFSQQLVEFMVRCRAAVNDDNVVSITSAIERLKSTNPNFSSEQLGFRLSL